MGRAVLVGKGRGCAVREAPNQRIANLRFGIERLIEKAKYDEYGTFESVRERIVELANEILRDDDALAKSQPRGETP